MVDIVGFAMKPEQIGGILGGSFASAMPDQEFLRRQQEALSRSGNAYQEKTDSPLVEAMKEVNLVLPEFEKTISDLWERLGFITKRPEMPKQESPAKDAKAASPLVGELGRLADRLREQHVRLRSLLNSIDL